jgi:hypothetical protein
MEGWTHDVDDCTSALSLEIAILKHPSEGEMFSTPFKTNFRVDDTCKHKNHTVKK